jgi:SMI1 / KNR4 family (SUKH-1)
MAKGATEQALQQFESDHAVKLPTDLREYFVKCNGMVQRGGVDTDKEGFAFWPIEKVGSMRKVCLEAGVALPSIQSSEEYFVFADYLQWSWAYAIRLGGEENSVILVGAEGDVVAGSFSEFVKLYIEDAEALYPKQSEQIS